MSLHVLRFSRQIIDKLLGRSAGDTAVAQLPLVGLGAELFVGQGYLRITLRQLCHNLEILLLGRLGEIDGYLKGLDLFIIDHHKTSSPVEGVKSYINPLAPACSYLIQIFYEMIIGDIPKDISEIIFFGICTDTGFFRFLSDDSAPVFAAVSRLVSYGANPKLTYNQINNGKPYSTRKLLGVLLQKAERYLEGRLVITYETMEETKKYGSEGRDSDALYQLMLSAKDVEAVVFLRQDTPLTCTGGFRSQDKIDVSVVAAKFGGGGHKNASGMSCNGKVETLIPQIVKEFARII